MSRLSVHAIKFQVTGEKSEGFLSIMDCKDMVPFKILRTFLAYDTPEHIERGGHAHHNTEMILIAAKGTITVQTEDKFGNKQEAVLDSPENGLFLPTLCWHTMRYSLDAIQLVLASTCYDPKDYIRSYDMFRKACSKPT